MDYDWLSTSVKIHEASWYSVDPKAFASCSILVCQELQD